MNILSELILPDFFKKHFWHYTLANSFLKDNEKMRSCISQEQNRTTTSVSIINHWGMNLGNIRLNMGLPWCSVDNESAFNVGDVSLIPGLGRPSGGGNGNPLHYSCLENPMDRGYIPWGNKETEATEHIGWIGGCCPWGSQSRTWLSNEAQHRWHSGQELASHGMRCKKWGVIPESGRSRGGGHSNPFQHSCLENPIDRGAWRATAHRIEKSWTWLRRLSTHTGWIWNTILTFCNTPEPSPEFLIQICTPDLKIC